jgi:hypothetical protein
MRKSQRKTEPETNIRAIIGRWAQVPADFALVPYSIVYVDVRLLETISRRR